ncbi:hypothetical protein AWL63_24035 (plasmid) [Sphingomonas panacis]|uniref:SMP-30/Gluconolactonase/LRE-like region domain-containing protein n=1 Tax=Sphingomonas panacis TaxID=1560345 RepID=A0A1B3ZIJ1_9SPHN|nr:SMP-30/gluconolactonase/LRE family protein [Sphingomonas panacis]AOH87231.1 hypothetical protein AWL63_24035 [Sphingomonas panacis]
MGADKKATLAVNSRDMIGESPVWDILNDRVLWIDKASGTIHEGKADKDGKWGQTNSWTLDRKIGAVILRREGGLIVTSGTEIYTLDHEGELELFAETGADPDLVQLNDAKCDPQGRLWSGTFALDGSASSGELYRIDPDGGVSTLLSGIGLSNGLGWSPDGTIFYYIDSFTGAVDAFDFDGRRGTISNRRSVIRCEGVGIDGMTVDDEGCVWFSAFGTSDVRRFSPDGAEIGRVEVGDIGVTSCEFGGSDLGELFITTAAGRLPEPLWDFVGFTADMADRAAAAPGAGGLFVCRPGSRGQPASRFAG